MIWKRLEKSNEWVEKAYASVRRETVVSEWLLIIGERETVSHPGWEQIHKALLAVDGNHLALTDLTLGDALVQVTIQTPVEYEAKYAVEFPLMLKVVQHFFQTGEVLQSVRWELDNTGKEAT
jgi:hypothetical protein